MESSARYDPTKDSAGLSLFSAGKSCALSTREEKVLCSGQRRCLLYVVPGLWTTMASTGGSRAHDTSSRPRWRGFTASPGRFSNTVDKVVEVPVENEGQHSSSPCRLTVDCASETVHRESVGHSSYATEADTHCAHCAADQRLHSAVLGMVVDAPVVLRRQVPW